MFVVFKHGKIRLAAKFFGAQRVKGLARCKTRLSPIEKVADFGQIWFWGPKVQKVLKFS